MHKTADYPAYLVGCALALAVASVAACRQIIDFDEPRQASDDADAGKLFEPKPFLSGPECTRCIEDNCQVQNGACAADDFCSRWLEGMRELDGPVIAAPDFYREFLDRAWAFTRGEQDADYQQFAEFNACVETRCKTACELGRDFSCVDRFDWPARYPRRIELRLHIADRFSPATSLDGWRVRACARQILCEPPLGEVMTQDGGFATLPVDLSLAPGVVLPEFYGFLLFDGGTEYPQYPRVQFDQSAPYYDRDFYGSLNPLTSDLISSVGDNIGLPYDANRGLLQIYPYDCSQWFAAGVTVEVWNDEGGLLPCGADCRLTYPGDNAIPDRNLEDFSSQSFGPAIASVGPGNIMVIMRDTKTRLPLSVLRPVTVRAGYVHMIHLYPASRGQLADLPKQAR